MDTVIATQVLPGKKKKVSGSQLGFMEKEDKHPQVMI